MLPTHRPRGFGSGKESLRGPVAQRDSRRPRVTDRVESIPDRSSRLDPWRIAHNRPTKESRLSLYHRTLLWRGRQNSCGRNLARGETPQGPPPRPSGKTISIARRAKVSARGAGHIVARAIPA